MAKIPAFSLPASDGKTWSLKDLTGKTFVLYFYPKDATPGCTVEACDFRDHQQDFSKAGVPVIGVSPDPLTSHAKFIAKQKLNFILLADERHELAEKLGVWGEKSMYGKTFMGIIRSTFLVAADGTIAQEWRKVKVDGHVAEVLEAAKGLAIGRTHPKKLASPRVHPLTSTR
ncbi:MAG: thioredoxin-dependent thiol peroxidase [Planctomycetes bacterium]|nr:thioredoxin-dependent thiol peroxidase [Planctomycetota bacterium]